MDFCGLEESVEKACHPSTRMVFIGVLFGTEALSLFVTKERLTEIKLLVQNWLSFETATLKQLQSLIGKLKFVAHCVKPSRIFISRLLNWLKEIPEELKKDLRWRYVFLPRFNGVAMMDQQEWGDPDGLVASDSCLTGCGSFSEGKYFHTVFPDFILDQKLHINCLELLAIMVTVKLWGKFKKGKKLVLYTDNQNSCRALNTGSSRNPFMQSCLRENCFLAAIGEIQIRAKEISGISNRIQDYLSRYHESPKYRDMFFSAVSKLNENLFEYFIIDDYFRFSNGW